MLNLYISLVLCVSLIGYAIGQTHPNANSPRCNSSGTFEFGACTCNPGKYGKNCECDGSNLNTQDYDAVCRSAKDSDVCEGRGECVCGYCNCSPVHPGDFTRKYSGSFCQCDDYSCDYYDGLLCGGPSRGKCECGTCKCNPGFDGPACGCQTSPEPCRAKSTGLICNNKGVCDCGRCICDRYSDYRGPTCEDCPTCPGKCEQNKACVQCMAFGSGEFTPEDCEANCSHIELVDIVEENGDEKMCRFRDEDDCLFYFTYDYNGKVKVQITKECPRSVNSLSKVLRGVKRLT